MAEPSRAEARRWSRSCERQDTSAHPPRPMKAQRRNEDKAGRSERGEERGGGTRHTERDYPSVGRLRAGRLRAGLGVSRVQLLHGAGTWKERRQRSVVPSGGAGPSARSPPPSTAPLSVVSGPAHDTAGTETGRRPHRQAGRRVDPQAAPTAQSTPSAAPESTTLGSGFPTL